jgi:hypothetical protein
LQTDRDKTFFFMPMPINIKTVISFIWILEKFSMAFKKTNKPEMKIFHSLLYNIVIVFCVADNT